jgi:hypothetical protein
VSVPVQITQAGDGTSVELLAVETVRAGETITVTEATAATLVRDGAAVYTQATETD